MKITVFGAGAIGGYLAGLLARAGHNPALVARGATLTAVQADGLTVERPGEAPFTVRLTATDDPGRLGPQDVVLIATKAHQIKVGDEEGHMLILSESKQVWFDEKSGEKLTRVGTNIMDINLKTGKGSLIRSYGVLTSANGDKRFTVGEGKPVGKGHWKGTYTYTGGTGKFEGIKGGGTWDSKSLAPGTSYIEVEGEMELSGQ